VATAYEEKLAAFQELLTNADLGYADELQFNGKPLPCISPGKEFFRQMKRTNYIEQTPAKFQIYYTDFVANKITFQSIFTSNGQTFQVHTYEADPQNEPSVILICNRKQ